MDDEVLVLIFSKNYNKGKHVSSIPMVESECRGSYH